MSAQKLFRIQAETIKQIQLEVAKLKSQTGKNSQNGRFPHPQTHSGRSPRRYKLKKSQGKRTYGRLKGQKWNEWPWLNMGDLPIVDPPLIGFIHSKKITGNP